MIDVKALRKDLKMTQEQLAHHLGVPCITVSRWESAKSRPLPSAIRKLMRLRLANKSKGGIMDELLTLEQVAAELGVSYNTVRNYITSRALDTVKIGKRITRVKRVDLEKFTEGK